MAGEPLPNETRVVLVFPSQRYIDLRADHLVAESLRARLQAKDVAIPARELPDRRLVVDPSPDEVERLAEVIAAWVVEVGAAERPAEGESRL